MMIEALPTQDVTNTAVRSWSTRTLIAALTGILFLTLYPFEFSRHTSLAPGRSPFFLGIAGKGGGTLDVILNILLFMPFGFAFAAELRKVKSWPLSLLYTWFAGALLSYAVEFLQIYIPARDSGWEDVFSNSTGAALGCILFIIIGHTVFRVLGNAERSIQRHLSARRAFVLAAVIFVAWTLYSIQLQKQSHFDTWDAEGYLVFANDATGRRPWKGKILSVELWDRAIDSSLAGKLTANVAAVATAETDQPLARFDFSSLPPREDGAELLIPLSSILIRDSSVSQSASDGAPLVASSRPVSRLTADLQKTNQFSIHLIFTPATIADSAGRIVSISPPSGVPSLFVGQENADLYFWFRNRLSVKRPPLAWQISKLLAPAETRNLLFCFDGADLRLYTDGRELQHRYWGPGTALASLLHHTKQGELNGYRDIFCAAVFLPIGCLLGLAGRNIGRPSVGVIFSIGAGLLLMPFILEFELSVLDGRPFSISNFALSVFMLFAGMVWINADNANQPLAPQT